LFQQKVKKYSLRYKNMLDLSPKINRTNKNHFSRKIIITAREVIFFGRPHFLLCLKGIFCTPGGLLMWLPIEWFVLNFFLMKNGNARDKFWGHTVYKCLPISNFRGGGIHFPFIFSYLVSGFEVIDSVMISCAPIREFWFLVGFWVYFITLQLATSLSHYSRLPSKLLNTPHPNMCIFTYIPIHLLLPPLFFFAFFPFTSPCSKCILLAQIFNLFFLLFASSMKHQSFLSLVLVWFSPLSFFIFLERPLFWRCWPKGKNHKNHCRRVGSNPSHPPTSPK